MGHLLDEPRQKLMHGNPRLSKQQGRQIAWRTWVTDILLVPLRQPILVATDTCAVPVSHGVRPKSAPRGGWGPGRRAIARLAGPRAQSARRQQRRLRREGVQAQAMSLFARADDATPTVDASCTQSRADGHVRTRRARLWKCKGPQETVGSLRTPAATGLDGDHKVAAR